MVISLTKRQSYIKTLPQEGDSLFNIHIYILTVIFFAYRLKRHSEVTTFWCSPQLS